MNTDPALDTAALLADVQRRIGETDHGWHDTDRLLESLRALCEQLHARLTAIERQSREPRV